MRSSSKLFISLGLFMIMVTTFGYAAPDVIDDSIPLTVNFIEIDYGQFTSRSTFRTASQYDYGYPVWNYIGGLDEIGTHLNISIGDRKPGFSTLNLLNDEWYAILSLYLADIKVQHDDEQIDNYTSRQKGIDFRFGLREKYSIFPIVYLFYQIDIGFGIEKSANTPSGYGSGFPNSLRVDKILWSNTTKTEYSPKYSVGLGLMLEIDSNNSVKIFGGINSGKRPGFSELEDQTSPRMYITISLRRAIQGFVIR